jgi:hypothetical protein
MGVCYDGNSAGTGRGELPGQHREGIRRMKAMKLAGAVAATATSVGVGVATAESGSAANNIKPFGVQETFNDFSLPLR